MSRVICKIVLCLAGWATLAAAQAGPPLNSAGKLSGHLTVAAASDLQFVLPEVAKRFEKGTGIKVTVVTGSSGNFFAQIENGAPFDIFFSADLEYPRRLQAGDYVEPYSSPPSLPAKGSSGVTFNPASFTVYEYGQGKLVLWTRRDSGIDVRQGLDTLLDARVKKIAIANPAHAPYGRAAVSALGKVGLWDKVSHKIVLGENISQTLQFAVTGNSDAAIVALALALAPGAQKSGEFYLIPQSLYEPIRQGAVVLRSSRNKDGAQRFMEFMRTPQISALLKQYGFGLPGEQAASLDHGSITKAHGGKR